MRLEDTKDEIYKKKKKIQQRDPNHDVSTKNTTPITARPHHTL